MGKILKCSNSYYKSIWKSKFKSESNSRIANCEGGRCTHCVKIVFESRILYYLCCILELYSHKFGYVSIIQHVVKMVRRVSGQT